MWRHKCDERIWLLCKHLPELWYNNLALLLNLCLIFLQYLHGPHASGSHESCPDSAAAPPDLLCVANAMMPQLILRSAYQSVSLLSGFKQRIVAPWGSNFSVDRFNLKVFHFNFRLIQHMRQNSISLDGFLGAVNAADKFITMLHDLSSMGAAMRAVMTHALTNPQVSNPD